MHRCAATAVAVLTLAGCGSCRPSGANPSTERAPPLAPWSGKLVARSLLGMTLVPLRDDGVLLQTGYYIDSLSPDGTVERLGSPADYLARLQEDDDEIAGYDAVWGDSMRLSGTSTRPFLGKGYSGPIELAWDGRTWRKAVHDERVRAQAQDRSNEHLRSVDAGSPLAALVAQYIWVLHAPVAGGRVVWMGRRTAAGEDGGLPVFVLESGNDLRPVTLPTSNAHWCHFVATADDGTYLKCRGDTKSPVRSSVDDQLYRLDGERWAPIDLTRAGGRGPDSGASTGDAGRDEDDSRVYAVDAEGGLWSAGGSPMTIVRLTKSGEAQHLALPRCPDALTAPTYRTNGPVYMSTKDVGVRSWSTMTIADATPPGTDYGAVSVVPRRSGDVWLVARESHDLGAGEVLVRFARGTPTATPPILLRSWADQHVESPRLSRGATLGWPVQLRVRPFSEPLDGRWWTR